MSLHFWCIHSSFFSRQNKTWNSWVYTFDVCTQISFLAKIKPETVKSLHFRLYTLKFLFLARNRNLSVYSCSLQLFDVYTQIWVPTCQKCRLNCFRFYFGKNRNLSVYTQKCMHSNFRFYLAKITPETVESTHFDV